VPQLRLRLLAPDGVVPPGPPAATRLTWALHALTLVRRRDACRRWAQANNVHAQDAAQRFRLGRC
jgi:hypothetical protein